MDAILVLNAGSSSLKFAAYEAAAAAGELRLIGKGRIAQHGPEVELRVERADGMLLEQSTRTTAAQHFDHDQAMGRLFGWLDEHRGGLTLAAVGHRVVHGGQHHTAPVRVTDEVLSELDTLVPLAPLHQPYSLAAIRALRERMPALAQVACFDTAFHATQPPVAQAFALPREVTSAGVRRYGFHGLSYEFVASRLAEVVGEKAGGRVVVAHLGNGASLCALQGGRSVAATTGFSTLDGLMMGTRCGALDAGAVLYLLQQRGMSAQQVSDLLYLRSGLLGVSGLSGDMQVLLDSDDPHAAEAVALFVYRVVCEIGALAAALGGLDALVFTAGIGANSSVIRARVCAGCAWLGAELDEDANAVDLELIHAPTSALRLAVIPTDEEQMIARHTLRCTAPGLSAAP
ncbi:MAG TPA: acetate/propionate family kinase [Ideonella sp.]|nr:acetate/propionate family kinase [Ideonella sp.]